MAETHDTLRIDDAERETADLADYLRVVRERGWIIAIAVVVVVAITLAVSLTSTPQYRASARLLYQKSNLDQALFGSQVFSNTNQDRDVQTGATLVKLDPVAASVATALDSQKTGPELLDMVTVKAETNTNVIDIQVVSADAAEAAAVANAFAEQFILSRQTADRATVAAARELVKKELDSLSSRDAQSAHGLMLKEKYENLRILESMQDGAFTLVQRAGVPTEPFSPQPLRNGVLALVVGLVLGFGLAFLLDYLDRRIRDEKVLEKEFGVPILAGVPAIGGRWRTHKEEDGGRGSGRSSAPVGFSSHPALLEPFRTLRSSLQYFDIDKNMRMRTILITSGLPMEGKTITTVNLALSLALSGKRVIILEADLRRPMVHEYLELDQHIGLSNVLAGTRQLADALQIVKADQFVPAKSRRGRGEHEDAMLLQRNLYALTSGNLPPNPAELLSSAKMIELLQDVGHMADYTLIDTPPVLMVSDALALATHVDAVIVAARLNATTREQAQETRNALNRAGARVIGVVAGDVKRHGSRYGRYTYGYGYRYGYGYGYEDTV
ncbi:MAG: Wzz/FepE/Etk N-terminal domain-containing protein [Thermoleophilia bacterium]|jgi:succinoglycan biosynthesis transport protein ExoP